MEEGKKEMEDSDMTTKREEMEEKNSEEQVEDQYWLQLETPDERK